MPMISLRGVHINFPFEPYACQEAYMDKVLESLQTGQNAVLESPTGTGKTLCLLCSCLGWLQGRKAQTELNRQIHISSFVEQGSVRPENVNSLVKSLEASTGQTWGGAEFAVPKIIYASRTHSQLSQAVNELKRTAYNSMKVSVIGSREQLCIHEQVRKEQSNTNKVHMCRAKVNARTCFYYNKFDDVKRNSDARHLVGNVVDIEDIVGYGEKNKVCPYYLAKELKNDAEIIFMPYNYLLDAKSRKAHGVELQGNVVIFDEAHNLEKICEESSSFDLTTADLATAIEEVCRLADKFVEMAQAEAQSLVEMTESSMPEPEFTLEDLLRMKSTLKELEDNLDSMDIGTGSNGVTHPGMFMFEFLSKVNIGFETKNFFTNLLDKMINYLTSDTSAGFTTKAAGLSKIADVFKIVFSRESRLGESMHIHQQTIAKYYKVSNIGILYCLNLTSREYGNSSRGVEFESQLCFTEVMMPDSTLDTYVRPFNDTSVKYCTDTYVRHFTDTSVKYCTDTYVRPSLILLSSIVQTLMSGLSMILLLNIVQTLMSGLSLILLLSIVLTIMLNIVLMCDLFQKLNCGKRFLIAMEGYYEKINDPSLNGAIFVAVCRGKVSEGLDFSDINGRAVIITGLPYPPRMDPKVKLKMEFLDEMKGKQTYQTLTGNDWYKQQASRAVNQAIGRVIRHRHDYGAIILCDTRFSYENSVKQLPIWVRPHVNKYNSFGQSLKDIMVFFKAAEKTLPAPQPQKKKQLTAGCHGAHFAPTLSRAKVTPKLEQARKVEQHVKSLRNTEEENARLQIQYEQTRQSVVKNKKHSLLGALTESEKTDTDLLDDSFDTNLAFNKPIGLEAKIPVKKKIVIKKRESSPKTLTQKILGVKDMDGKSTTTSQITSATSSSVTSGQGETVSQVTSQTHLHTAEAYIAQVKQVLGPVSYKLYTKAMVDYKQTSNIDNLTSVLANIFMEDEVHMDLFRRFYTYVRPHHRRQFDELCCNLTGQGCGFKPEHAVSKKRVQKEMAGNDGASKRQKTDASSTTVQIQSDSDCGKTNSVASLKSVCQGPASEKGIKDHFPEKALALGSTATSANSGTNSRDLKDKRTVLGPQELSTNNTLDKSSEDLFGDETPQQVEKKDKQIKTDQQNGTDGKKEMKAEKTETICMPSMMERLKHVTGPLDIRSKIKEETGYTCCLCKEDATTPFKRKCLKIFFCRSLKVKDKLCPECGVKDPDMYNQPVLRRQFKDHEQTFTGNVDIWSLGVTLYHVATDAFPSCHTVANPTRIQCTSTEHSHPSFCKAAQVGKVIRFCFQVPIAEISASSVF
ncbi:Regulator of telomere elongation helicase 1 [Mizuhopecten yessoensis]|uniref:Regulator of telomere elongation helicase 1 n=1 Tax=Mizuhopecten yessoensis TaxID=6573 RepID=A0A210QSM8_MIZYE|nr:Regulator of telomere elongation helicase 1 [Mizuhopecten yessoensis]